MLNLTQRLQQLRSPARLVTIGLLMALLASCAISPQAPGPSEAIGPEYVPELEKMATDGQFLDAALAYSRLANASEPPAKQQYSLRAAELLMDGNYVPQSYQLISEIDTGTLDTNLKIRLGLLGARIALARQLPDEAQAKLTSIDTLLSEQNKNQLLQYHQLRARAFYQQKQYLETARERVQLEPLLTDPQAVVTNQEAIVSALKQLSPQELQSARTDTNDTFNGWLDLVQMGMTMAETRESGDLAAWHERYPQHPALESVINSLLSARPRALTMPTQIAVILPLHNRFAEAATAIRDGFLAAYYAQPANTEGPSVVVPSIRIYDEGNDPESFDFAYAQAVNDGAEFVVGPLNKDAVTHLASRDDLPVPVLALNYTEPHGNNLPEKHPDNLYQISLSPEQEARQVAERAWLDGHSRVAIITADSPWGKRVARAFSKRWLQLGGHVVGKQTYNPQESDYSLPIRRLLNVDESNARERSLERTLGIKLEFIPRRRQDIDFIFMAAASRQARLIKPQLRFHHAPDVPVYATSHCYSGTVNKDMDRDMDGVRFLDMPWTLEVSDADSQLKAEISKNWPELEKQYSRLYALGIDAFHIIGQLNSLRRNRSEFYRGETGDLFLDANNRLERRLIWARFVNGIPELINDFQPTAQN